MRARMAAVLLLLGALAGCAPAPEPSTDWPTSIAVLGHSGATGYNSDSAHPGEDAKTNSWATGTNPDVDSVYLRALEVSPSLEGHAGNYAVSGSSVDDLPAQVEQMLRDGPSDLVIIQSVDNDIRCNGTDDANEPVYREKITAVLQSIVDAEPGAMIYVVGQWASSQVYAAAAQGSPETRAANQGDGPCDLFDAAGNLRPDIVEATQVLSDAYGDQLRSACEEFPSCVYGGAEIGSLALDTEDLTSDAGHLSVRGLHEMAAVAWLAIEAAHAR